MTNFDPGGFLLLLTVIPAVVAGVVSVGVAAVASRLGYGPYERAVVVVLGLLLLGWIGASLVVSTDMLRILTVTLAMAGAYLVTRDVAAASVGWVLGVVLLFVAFAGLSAAGLYQGVDQTGRPQGLIARYLFVSYAVGLFAGGAVGGAVVQAVRERRRRF